MADYYNNQNQNPNGSTGSGGTDSSYHFSGAQGSFGSNAAQGNHTGYQAESSNGPIPEVKYTAVPPKKPKKKRGKIALIASLVSVGMICVIALSMVAGGMLAQRMNWSGSGSESDSQPEHLIISQTPTVSDGDDGTVVSTGLTTREIAAKALDSVVGINLYSSQQVERVGEASGIVLDTNGYIITNAHVVSDGYSPTVVFGDGTEVAATVIGYDTRTDLAMIKVDPTGLNLVPAEFGDSDTLQLGDDVVAIGNASGYYNSVSKGVVSGLNRDVSTNISIQLIQTDAAINPGNSGGALLNQYGQVVGINSSKLAGSEIDSMGFAIPVNDAKPIIDSLINYGYVKDRVALGVTVVALNDVNGAMMGLPSQGLYITQIDETSDLYAQGITRGDVILTAGGVTLIQNSDLLKELENYKPGDKIELTIQKGTGQTVTLQVELHEMTSNS